MSTRDVVVCTGVIECGGGNGSGNSSSRSKGEYVGDMFRGTGFGIAWGTDVCNCKP